MANKTKEIKIKIPLESLIDSEDKIEIYNFLKSISEDKWKIKFDQYRELDKIIDFIFYRE